MTQLGMSPIGSTVNKLKVLLPVAAMLTAGALLGACESDNEPQDTVPVPTVTTTTTYVPVPPEDPEPEVSVSVSVSPSPVVSVLPSDDVENDVEGDGGV